MNCLLDTQALIWTLMQPGRLSPDARDMIVGQSAVKHVSVVSLNELPTP